MIMNNKGTLPSQELRKFIKQNLIHSSLKEINENQIQPSSLDLTITNKAFRVSGMFLPKKGEKISDILKKITIYEQDLDKQPILEKDVVYVIELNEELSLPQDIYGYCSSKSSTGRLNIQTKLICDNTDIFDKVEKGYKGKLYMLVISKSFLIGLTPGDSLNQITLHNGYSRLSDQELLQEHKKNSFSFDNEGNSLQLSLHHGILMSIDLGKKPICWRAKSNNEPLFLNKRQYNPSNYFEKVETLSDGFIILNEGEFYIFCTKEKISVPLEYSAEMVAFDSGIGEFRSHDAGFFDPGFGYGRGNIKGTSAVLEVRPYGNNIIIRDCQPICKMVFDRVTEIPDKAYGVELKSHYQQQEGPRLSKHFSQ